MAAPHMAPASASNPDYLTNTPFVVAANPGHDVSLSSILSKALGPDYGNYDQFWIAYYGAQSLQNFDFSNWNLNNPQVAKWLVNGTDIGPDFGNQQLIQKADVGSAKLQAGKDFVLDLSHGVNLTHLDIHDFI